MPTNRQYRWRPAPWRVGESNGGKAVATTEEKTTEEGGKKNGGTIALVLLGAGAVAFGVLELMGVTKVFTTAPTVPAALPPGTTPAPAAGAAPAAAPK